MSIIFPNLSLLFNLFFFLFKNILSNDSWMKIKTLVRRIDRLVSSICKNQFHLLLSVQAAIRFMEFERN